MKFTTALVPGPGTYNPDISERSPQWKFSQSPKTSSLKTHTPGPGEYDIKPTLPNVASYYNI
ncbi:hypothetical protein M1146_08320, partial [Patescibacteria group bacterium]|nr:hypothetical protein [Patescibacteria group bacterium]